MTLKNEFRTCLERGGDHEELVTLVRQHKAAGLGQREAYDQLQKLWLEYGFHDENDDGNENPIRENLEYVMEIVWGFCPAGRAIWEGSLSNEKQPTSQA